MNRMNDAPLVSVVIPTYNSEETLAKCLESIKNQTYKNIEVIVVDRFSKDRTVEIAKKYKVKLIQGDFNKPQARNVGILNSKGKYIFLGDSDFVFKPTLIKEAVKCFNENKCDAIFVPERYVGNDFLSRCRNLEKRIYEGIEEIESPRIFRRWIFSKLLFDEKNEGPDEYDFYFSAKRLGIINTCRIKSKIFLLEKPLKLPKKFRHGKYFYYFKTKHSGEEKLIKKQISFGFRLSLLFNGFKHSKTETLGLIIFKALEFLSFSLGIFIGMFDRKIQKLCMSVKEEFDNIGEKYEEQMYRGSFGNVFVDKIERKVVLEMIKRLFNNKKIKVLDVGAGTGRWTGEFLKLGYKVTALDISEKMCSYLEKKFKKLRVVCGNIETAKLRGKYELIFSFRSFKYLLNRKCALENIRNHLKENGYVVIEMPNKYNLFYFIPYRTAPLFYVLSKKKVGKYFMLTEFVSEKEFKKELEEFGFNVIKTQGLFFFPHKIYSKINSKHLISLVYYLDRMLSILFPRSIVYLCKLKVEK